MKLRLINPTPENARYREALAALQSTFIDRIVKLVASHFGVDPSLVRSIQGGPQRECEIRFAAIYLIDKFTTITGTDLAARLQSDHTNIYYAIRRAGEIIEVDPIFRAHIRELETKLRASLKC